MNKVHHDDLKIHTNADMSHQNRLWFKLSLLFDSIRNNGLKETFDRLKLRIYYRLKGVDFSTENLHHLTLTGENKTHGTALVSTSRHFFRRLMQELEHFSQAPIKKNLFIDYGSGKGAALIHARQYGFEKVIGVEFAKELHEKALENIQKLHLDNTISLHEDAAAFTPPPETTLIYFFNPFDAVVMEKVAQKITQTTFHNDPYIIYGRPTCAAVMERYFTLLGSATHESGAVVNYYQYIQDRS